MKSKKCISLRETWQSVGGWSTGPEETRLSINDTAPQSLLCQDIIDKARKVCPKNVKTGERHCPGYNKEAFTNRQAFLRGRRKKANMPWYVAEICSLEVSPCPDMKTAIVCGRVFEVSKTAINPKHICFCHPQYHEPILIMIGLPALHHQLCCLDTSFT